MATSLISVAQDSIGTIEEVVPLITNRPGLTEASRAVYKGGFQLEMGLEYGKTPTSKGSSEYSDYILLPNIGFLYGVSNNVELRVFGNNQGSRNNHTCGQQKYDYSVDNVFVGTKINLLKSKGWIPELALVINQGIPTDGSSDLKSWASTGLLAWSYSLPSNFALSGNLGYTNEKITQENVDMKYQHGLLYTLNLGYAIKSNIGTYVELNGSDLLYQGNSFPINVDGGFWYRVNPHLQVDALAGYGFEVENYFVNIGMSWLLLK